MRQVIYSSGEPEGSVESGGVRSQEKCDGQAAGQAACSRGDRQWERLRGGNGGKALSARPFSTLHFHHSVHGEGQGHLLKMTAFPPPGKRDHTSLKSTRIKKTFKKFLKYPNANAIFVNLRQPKMMKN